MRIITQRQISQVRGTIRLYAPGRRKAKRSLHYSSLEERKMIVGSWRRQYGMEFEKYHYHIVPDTTEAGATRERIAIEVVQNRPQNVDKVKEVPMRKIEMPDFIFVNGVRRESFYNQCYHRKPVSGLR